MYTGARRITPGTPTKPGRGVTIAGPASGEGFVGLILEDNTVMDVYFLGGTLVVDDVAVIGVSTAGGVTTATGFRVNVLG